MGAAVSAGTTEQATAGWLSPWTSDARFSHSDARRDTPRWISCPSLTLLYLEAGFQ